MRFIKFIKSLFKGFTEESTLPVINTPVAKTKVEEPVVKIEETSISNEPIVKKVETEKPVIVESIKTEMPVDERPKVEESQTAKEIKSKVRKPNTDVNQQSKPKPKRKRPSKPKQPKQGE